MAGQICFGDCMQKCDGRMGGELGKYILYILKMQMYEKQN